LDRRLLALWFGVIDMYDAFQTAQYLRGDHPDAPGHGDGLPVRVRRTLVEAGMVVTNARPFVDGSRGHGTR